MSTDGLEIRSACVEDLRVESRGVARVLRGYAIVFNQLSQNLGGFRERILPSAIDRTLRAGTDLRALANHDHTHVLGRLTAGTLRVKKDSHGLGVEIDPPETTMGQDIVESIRRRDITAMSFAFSLLPDWATFSEVDPDGVPIRDVHDMLVREVSIVAFPAFPQAEVALREHQATRVHAQGWPQTVSERLRWAAGR